MIGINNLFSKLIDRENLALPIKGKAPLSIVKINSEILLRSFKQKEFRDSISGSLIIIDGVGVQWAVRYLDLPISKIPVFKELQAIFQMVWTGSSLIFYSKYCGNVCERIPGQEAFNLMLGIAEKEGKNVYILGGEQDVLDKAVSQIKKDFPRLKLVGSMEGWNFKDENAIKDINDKKAELLFVALGSPKQEYWIRDNLDKLKTVKVAVGEGGTLDFVAGTFKRAPKWMRSLGLEWLWRLFMNRGKTLNNSGKKVSRLKRVWNAVPVFIYEVVKYKIKNAK